ncbi:MULTISPECIES: hypothetical protein [unclassified Arenibacter]|uniref:hypothetical protein n=1 Tax=unclassified Arenibacter TaxID=2615047 RepID=UPI000E346588|nr:MULTISPECIES: hypothetical protein [unclassified Arenibacter]MCM4162290.1 hypothetical protein [Arenibacter sp. A80]RFT57892.1 hypothetical protein D0S24_01645 [Arenibacter sp. P308M17]
MSILAVLWVYEKGHEKPISLQQEALPNTRQLIVELLKPTMDNLNYWEQYPIAKSDFYPQKIAHFDHVIVGLVIGMDSDYPFGTIDLSGKTVHDKNRLEHKKCVIANTVKQSAQWATDRFVPRDDEKLFLSFSKISKGNHT